MSPWLWIGIGIVIAVDVVVLTTIVRKKMQAAGLDLGKITSLSKATHDRIGEYMRCNYRGDPAHLPAVMPGLLEMVAETAHRDGIDLDTPILETLVTSSLMSHKVASRAQIDHALAEMHETEKLSKAA